MRQVLFYLSYWSYIQLSAAFPIEETPGFTPWPLEKRNKPDITALEFSGLKGAELGVSKTSNFGIIDKTCRGKLPGKGCWEMNQFTVDKMIDAREPKANNCPVPCLFYTENLSGAAERTAHFILWDALLEGASEGERKYQTIWDLHAPKYYPNVENLDATPEVKCAYLDVHEDDMETRTNGCRRSYFMSMSKAMAAQCSGEVFLMTMTDLHGKKDVPENGIWWEVEFPTLIDERRAADKKITKITYLQVPKLSKEEFEMLKKLPEDQRSPPEILYQGEYWPKGHGKTQLEKSKNPVKPRDSWQKNSPAISGNQEDSQHKHSPSTVGFVKRADRSDVQVCAYGEDCYPYPYPMNDMFEWYKDLAW